MQLIISHGIIGAFKPQYIFGILQCGMGWTCYPQSFGRIAAKCLALISATAIETWFAAFLETNDVLLAGNAERKGQVLEIAGLLSLGLLGGKHKMGGKCLLCWHIYMTVLKEGIELLDVVVVVLLELQYLIVLDIEGRCAAAGFDDISHIVGDGLVE